MSGSSGSVVPIQSEAPAPGGGWVGLARRAFRARACGGKPSVAAGAGSLRRKGNKCCVQIAFLPTWTEQVAQPELAW